MRRVQDGADDTARDEIVRLDRRLIERAKLGPAADFSRERFMKSGVRFNADVRSFRAEGFDQAARARVQAFGHWLDAPGFVGIDEMKAAMKQADPRDLWVMNPFSDICEKRSLH